MPIVIKELFASDPLSEALEKINFNFDQMILAGGGPPGPQGVQGPQGVPGVQGLRGDHWQVGGASGAGFTGPLTDHGPYFGSLQSEDLWVDNDGKIWKYDEGPDSWIDSGVQIKGPKGETGPTGNSEDLQMFLGYTGGAQDGTSYVPRIGPVTVSQGNADFYTLAKIDKNSFFLGDVGWAYNKLKNFSKFDNQAGANTSIGTQRVIPKQTIIQSGIDITGFGGLSIGAYGLTGGTSSGSNVEYRGGTAGTNFPWPSTDANSFFNAGWAINTITGVNSHVFRMQSGLNDIEIQSGNNSFLYGEVSNRKLTLTSNTIELKGLTDPTVGDPIRFSIGTTSSIYRDPVYVNFNSSQLGTLSTLVSNSDNASLIARSNARISGSLMVGNLSGATSSILLGYKRGTDGPSEINFYTESVTNSTPTFKIQRDGGLNGESSIIHYGTGEFKIRSADIDAYISMTSLSSQLYHNTGQIYISSPNNNILVEGGSSKNIIFRRHNDSTNEVARFDLANLRMGIGTSSPSTKLHVVANAATLRIQGTDHTYMELYAAGGGSRSGYVGYTSAGSIDLTLRNEFATGDVILSAGANQNIAGLSDVGPFYIGAFSGLSPLANDGIINLNKGGTGTVFFGANDSESWKITNRGSTGPLRFIPGNYSQNNIAVTIRQNGYVGINNDNPENLLDVIGGITTRSSAFPNLSFINTSSSVAGFDYFTKYSFLQGKTPSGNLLFTGAEIASHIYSNSYPNTFDTIWKWQTQNQSGILTDRLAIVGYNGRIGINTLTPDSQLDIDGNIQISTKTSGSVSRSLDFRSNWSGNVTNKITNTNNGQGYSNLSIENNGWTMFYLHRSTQNSRNNINVFSNSSFGGGSSQQFRITGVSTNPGLVNQGVFQITTGGSDTRPTHEFYTASNGGAYVIRGQEPNAAAENRYANNTFQLLGPNNGAGGYNYFSVMAFENQKTVYFSVVPNTTVTTSNDFRNDGNFIFGGNNVGGEGGAVIIASARNTVCGGEGGIYSRYSGVISRCLYVGFQPNADGTSRRINTTPNAKGIWTNGYAATGEAFINPSVSTQYITDVRLVVDGYIKTNGLFGTSDLRLKNILARLEDGSSLEKIMKINPAVFRWNEKSKDNGKIELGLIAQEIEEIMPEAVHTHKTENFEDERVLEYQAIFVMSIGAIKDQQKIIENQKEKINSLEDKISKIEELLKQHNII